MEDANWMGGSIYIDNLLAALSILPTAACPRVRLNFLSSSRTPLAERLLNHSVIGQTPHGKFAGNLIAAGRRAHRGFVRRWPWLSHLWSAPCNELFFPAFDTAQRWRKNLYWIPDFQPHHFPDLFEPAELAQRMQSFSDIAKAQGVVLLSSNAALADFRRFYPDATVEPRVWSFCSSIEAGSLESAHEILSYYHLPEKFIYIANQFWRHKDHATAFEALRLLRNRGMEIPLICTGLQKDRRDPADFETLTRELTRHGMERHVLFLGVVPREHQIQFFRSAAAIVQPSRFEGWSTVIEDAKALGKPIIASDIAVHREQLFGVDNTYLFRTSDASDLADRIAILWPDLSRGPVPHLELLAAERRDMVRLDAAHRFVDIVDEAIAVLKTSDSKNRKLQ
jgi:glycosyltransferase involved in cell wall biosynthesis